MKALITIFITTAILLYAAMSFIYLEPNLLMWDNSNRIGFAVFTPILTVLLFCVYKLKNR